MKSVHAEEKLITAVLAQSVIEALSNSREAYAAWRWIRSAHCEPYCQALEIGSGTFRAAVERCRATGHDRVSLLRRYAQEQAERARAVEG